MRLPRSSSSICKNVRSQLFSYEIGETIKEVVEQYFSALNTEIEVERLNEFASKSTLSWTLDLVGKWKYTLPDFPGFVGTLLEVIPEELYHGFVPHNQSRTKYLIDQQTLYYVGVRAISPNTFSSVYLQVFDLSEFDALIEHQRSKKLKSPLWHTHLIRGNTSSRDFELMLECLFKNGTFQ